MQAFGSHHVHLLHVCIWQLVQGKVSQQQYLKEKDGQQKRLQQLTDEVEAIAQQL